MKKKVLSFLLLLIGVTQGAMAQQVEAYHVISDDGKTVTFYYDDQRESRDGSTYFSSTTGITTAIIDVSYSNYRPTKPLYFSGWSSLTSIVGMKNLNTGNMTTMSQMFLQCSSLTSLDLSHFDTKNVTEMSDMFSGCSSLTSLDVSNFDTRNVTSMSGMFSGCSNLTDVDLSNFYTRNVTNMGGMFFSCSKLTNLDLSNFETSNVTNMFRMFGNCSSLKDLNVSNFDTDKVTDMTYMFERCSSLTNLDLSHFNTENVTNMIWMFSECSNMTSLDLSHFDTSKVADMGGLFHRCSSLTSLNLSNFDTSNVTGMYEMFSGCSSLTSLDLSIFDTGNVIDMYEMFRDCSSLTSVDLSHFDIGNVGGMSYMFDGCSKLTDIYCNNTWDFSYGDAMFSGCSNLPGYSESNSNDAAYAKPIADGGYFTPKTEKASKVSTVWWWTYYTDVRNIKADETTTVYTATLNADGTELTLNEVTDKTVPRGQAVIMKSTTGEPLLYTSTETGECDFSGNVLQGTQREMATSDVEGTVYVLAAEGGRLGFYSYTGEKLAANKVFLVLNGSSARSISIVGNEETGINDVAEQPTEGATYDLQGRRVSEQQKGLYIVNGKKIVKR